MSADYAQMQPQPPQYQLQQPAYAPAPAAQPAPGYAPSPEQAAQDFLDAQRRAAQQNPVPPTPGGHAGA